MTCRENGLQWNPLLRRSVLNFILVLLGMSAAYFTTIGSLKVQLAEKAESVLVEAIDKRLARMEVVIREGLIGKDNFYEFKSAIELRLSRIESYLRDYKGEESGLRNNQR
ncbi:MAG: hypothetical protein JSV44_05410 [Candidatus Zixiibacteriota bacterium]|nr:MAG: hypothetical protein JSV44_05410 [candidate division Zixibacteria bacterium]